MERDRQTGRETERQTWRKTDGQGERQIWRETDTERQTQREAEMGFDREGESSWPRECVVGRSELHGVGWQAGDPRGRVAAASRVQNLEAALGSKVGNSGTMSYDSACCLGAELLFLQEISVFALKALSTDGTRPTYIMGVISFIKSVDCRL